MKPPPDAILPPIRERRGKPDRRAGERRHLILVPPVERRSPNARRRVPDRRTGSETLGAATAEEAVRTALQLLITISETETLDDNLQRHLDAAIFRLQFAIERLQQAA
jgi:hypothetical protein